MKKFLAAIAVATALSSVPVFASDLGLDLTSMDTDKLVELQDMIKEELDSRGYSGNDEIGAGTFVAGTDIKEGSYTYEATEFSMLFTFESMEKLQASEVLSVITVNEGEKGNINLQTGQVLFISEGSGHMISDKPSWAP